MPAMVGYTTLGLISGTFQQLKDGPLYELW